MHTPYSLEEATKICSEHNNLSGQAFDPTMPINSTIDCVAVVPFDEVNKRRFLIYYLLFNDPKSALAHEYKGQLYDVLVIARSTEDEHEMLHESLYLWLEKNRNMLPMPHQTPNQVTAIAS